MRFERSITIEHKGKNYQGQYWVEEGWVYVHGYASDGELPRQDMDIGGFTPEGAARMLLQGLAEAGRLEPDDN